MWPVPALAPGDIVVIDNLASDKSPEIRKAIEAAGAGRGFLPALLARLQPDRDDVLETEDAAAKGRRTIRRSALEPHRRALDQFHQNECQNYFRAAALKAWHQAVAAA